MTFILGANREDDSDDWYTKYVEYLAANRHRFPPGAYALATSTWYFGFNDPRGPHDAWLADVTIREPDTGTWGEARPVSIRVRLLDAWNSGHIELVYPRVYAYRIVMTGTEARHGDWRYDEFRVTDHGHLLHEIEWWSSAETGTWLIEADDVEHRWTPLGPP